MEKAKERPHREGQDDEGRTIIRFIKKSKGLRFTEIQKFIVELNGRDWAEMETVKDWSTDPPKIVQKRKNRGYYCDGLQKLLGKWCDRVDGRWCVKHGMKIEGPFYPTGGYFSY